MTLRRTGIIAIIAVCGLLLADWADAQNNRNRNRRRNDQRRQLQRRAAQNSLREVNAAISQMKNGLSASRQKLDLLDQQASLARTKLEAAGYDVAAFMDQWRNSKAENEITADALDLIRDNVLMQIEDDETYIKLTRQWAEAKRRYDDAKKNILASDAYQDAYKLAMAYPDKLRRLPEVRQKFLTENSELAQLELQKRIAETNRNRLLQKFYEDHPEWDDARKAAVQSRLDSAATKAFLEGRLIAKFGASEALRQALKRKAAVEREIDLATNRIKQLQGRQDSLNRMLGRNPSSSKSPGDR